MKTIIAIGIIWFSLIVVLAWSIRNTPTEDKHFDNNNNNNKNSNI